MTHRETDVGKEVAMKRFILVLVVLGLALVMTDQALAGKRQTIRFDSLPLGILDGRHVIGDFIVQPIGFGGLIKVVDLGNGHRGLAANVTKGSATAGLSLVPCAPRTTMRLWSISSHNDYNWVKVMGQWAYPYELFYPTGSPFEEYVPTFAGKDIAFVNLVIYGEDDGDAVESFEVEVSKLVDPGYTVWATGGKNKMKVSGFGSDKWFSTGDFSFFVDDWQAEESDGTGASLLHAGLLSRLSKKKFTLTCDAAAKAEFEALCDRRFGAKTGEKGLFQVTSAVGTAKFNASRTKLTVSFEIRGNVMGSFGVKKFKLTMKSNGSPNW
jgi:hypothetical protein